MVFWTNFELNKAFLNVVLRKLSFSELVIEFSDFPESLKDLEYMNPYVLLLSLLCLRSNSNLGTIAKITKIYN